MNHTVSILTPDTLTSTADQDWKASADLGISLLGTLTFNVVVVHPINISGQIKVFCDIGKNTLKQIARRDKRVK